jgi:hypothetical protein
MDLKEISHRNAKCVYVAQERGHRLAFVDKGKNFFSVYYLEQTMQNIYINNEFLYSK